MNTSYDGAKCTNCKLFIPCYSIKWSQLPDNMKCRCASPGVPSLFEVLAKLFKGSR